MIDDGASLICIPLLMIKKTCSSRLSSPECIMNECMKWQSEKIMLIVIMPQSQVRV